MEAVFIAALALVVASVGVVSFVAAYRLFRTTPVRTR
jgi:hypothetical protein